MLIDPTEISQHAIDCFGEPATLLYRATRVPVTGIYISTPGGVSPLDGRTILPGVYFTIASSAAQGVNTTWQIEVRGELLPVIAAVPDGAGFVELYLGDPNA